MNVKMSRDLADALSNYLGDRYCDLITEKPDVKYTLEKKMRELVLARELPDEILECFTVKLAISVVYD